MKSKYETCIDNVSAALKDKLSKAEVRNIIKEIERRLPVEKMNRLELTPDIISKEIKQLGESLLRKKLEQKRRALLQADAHNKLDALVDTLIEQGLKPDKAMQAVLVGVSKNIKEGRWSIETIQRAKSAEFLGGFVADLHRADVMEFFLSRDSERMVAKELEQVNMRKGGKPGITKSKDALQVAELISKYQKAARNDLNRWGADIQEIDSYLGKQTHSREKIKKVGYEGWRDMVLSKLDRNRTFHGQNPDIFLKSVFDDILNGKYGRVTDEPSYTQGSLATQISKHRALHFKDSDAMLDYNNQFGELPFKLMVVQSLHKAARDVGILQTLGPNAEHGFERQMTRLKEKYHSDSDLTDRLKGVRGRQLQSQYDVLSGALDATDGPTLGKIGVAIRSFNNVTRLGGVLISSLNDIPVKALEIRRQGGTFLDGVGKSLGDIMGAARPAEKKTYAASMGAGMDAIIGSLNRGFGSGDGLLGEATKLDRIFFKLTGLTQWTDAHKVGFAAFMGHNLATQPARFGDISPDLQSLLSHYGIGEKDWGIVKQMARPLSDENPELYVVMDALDDIPDAAFGVEGMSAAQIKDARDNFRTRLGAFFTDRLTFGVIEPGARIKAITTGGLQRGTLWGEAARFFYQFKSFPLTFLEKAWGRELFSRGKADMAGIAWLAASSMIFGYMSMTLKGYARGENPRPLDRKATWGAAFVQGGGAGIVGDFLFGDYNRFGGGFLATMSGPTFSRAEEIFNLSAAWRDAATGDSSDPKAKTLKVALDAIPGNNLFWLRPALNYLIIYDWQESLNPGHAARMVRNKLRDQGATYWLPPTKAVR